MISINAFYNHGDLCLKTNACVAGQKSNFINWIPVPKHHPTNDYCYMHSYLLNANVKPNSFGMIWESRAIIPAVYQSLERHVQNFRTVYTPDSKLLETYPNTKWCPGGGIWIGGLLGEGENKIHNKSKMISLVSSAKKMCLLHEWRYNMAKSIYSRSSNVDVFLGENGWQPIYKSLHDYRFSVVIENNIDKWYFTEKIMNCFATGTVPIYVGATDIGKYFDLNGIIVANDFVDDKPKKFMDFINSLTERDYEQRALAIQKNYELVQKYRSIEDFIYKTYYSNGEMK